MSESFDHTAFLAASSEKPTLSQKFAEAVTGNIGSWPFVIGHAVVMGAWIAVNTTRVIPFIPQFDPSLILLNLALSTEAALGAAFILMSQNRQSEVDRRTAQHDLDVDTAADGRVNGLDKKLDMLLSILSPEQLKQIKEETFDSEDDAPEAAAAPERKPTLRERFSDAVTRGMGSWKFVIGHTLLQAAWIVVNTTNALPFIPQFDPNLTLMNLALSTEAAFAGAFILMSQNRQGEKDRKTVQHDLQVDINAERKLATLEKKLDAILAILTPDQLKTFAAARAAMKATVTAAAAETEAEALAIPAASNDDKAAAAAKPPKALQASGPKA